MKTNYHLKFASLVAALGLLCPAIAPAQQTDPFRIVVMGDSVMWGQGLRNEDKIHSRLAAMLDECSGQRNIQITHLAHSGAVISIENSTTRMRCESDPMTPLPGEVPNCFPTIMQQSDGFNDSPNTVDLVLVNGCINDIDARRILNPFVPSTTISEDVETHCHQNMIRLLKKVAEKFSNATIVVSGYYPMISEETDLLALFALLVGAGVIVGGEWAGVPGATIGAGVAAVVTAATKDTVVAKCRVFAEESAAKLRAAVKDINSARVRFADPHFRPQNAVLAQDPYLYGLDLDLSPQDPIAAERMAACARAGLNTVARETCNRASMGHPNPRGAQAYANAIFASIMNSESMIWVDFNSPCGLLPCDGTFWIPYNSLSLAAAVVAEGGTINIKPGSARETITITKKSRLQACGGLVTIGR
jgi:lysophospholipase L1-like esterase